MLYERPSRQCPEKGATHPDIGQRNRSCVGWARDINYVPCGDSRLDCVKELSFFEIRLSSLSVKMGVGSHEWLERTNLVPPCKHFVIWVPEKSTHIGASKRQTRKRHGPAVQNVHVTTHSPL